MKKIVGIILITFAAVSLSVGIPILYYHLASPNGMTFVSARSHDQNGVRQAIMESVQEEGFQIVSESEQGDTFQIQSDMDQYLRFNIRIDRQEDHFRVSVARPRWRAFWHNDRNQMAEACGHLLARFCGKMDNPETTESMKNPGIDQLKKSVQELAKSQS